MPDGSKSPSLRREVRDWVIAVAAAAPVLVVEWLILRLVDAPWNVYLTLIPFLVGLLVLGVLSKMNIWGFLVWLGPFAAFLLLWFAGIRNPLVSLGLVVTMGWVGGIMLSERLGVAAFRLVSGAHAWLSDLGLPEPKRRAYGELRRAMQVTAQRLRDHWQLEELSGTVRGYRDEALRMRALVPPDERWAEVYEAFATSIDVWADMLEGKRPADFDRATELAVHGRQQLEALLRDESITYRILTYVPFG
jgi:hypothetical protein